MLSIFFALSLSLSLVYSLPPVLFYTSRPSFSHFVPLRTPSLHLFFFPLSLLFAAGPGHPCRGCGRPHGCPSHAPPSFFSSYLLTRWNRRMSAPQIPLFFFSPPCLNGILAPPPLIRARFRFSSSFPSGGVLLFFLFLPPTSANTSSIEETKF